MKKENDTFGVEQHPLEPFLPRGARLLMLGSFPPPRERWSMDFFYPNLQNDMWRIMGLVFYDDRDRFVDTARRCFRYGDIVSFCRTRGLAIFDTASAVRRLRGNASDQYLEVVRPTDVTGLLQSLPDCKAVCTTGQKATDVLCGLFGCDEPGIGSSVEIVAAGRTLRFYRMPSSSRAYPLPMERKAEPYRRMLAELDMIE